MNIKHFGTYTANISVISTKTHLNIFFTVPFSGALNRSILAFLINIHEPLF